MLDMNGKEVQQGFITIDNISNTAMQYILKYLYTDEQNLSVISQQLALEIASAADYLQVDRLKEKAFNHWQDSLAVKTPKMAMNDFQSFVNSALPMDLDQEVKELMLIGMHSEGYKLANESNELIEYFVKSFGSSHPFTTMKILSEWILSEGKAIDEDTYFIRDCFVASLVDKINLQKLTLRSIARLSSVGVFRSNYMLAQIHRKSESKDSSVCGEVSYIILIKKNRIVELEHETGFVLFHYQWFKEGIYKNSTAVWHLIHVPYDCSTAVCIVLPDKKAITWPADAKGGHLGEAAKNFNLVDESGVVTINITLKCKKLNVIEQSKQPAHQYTIDFTK